VYEDNKNDALIVSMNGVQFLLKNKSRNFDIEQGVNTSIKATTHGLVSKIHAKIGDVVEAGQLLVEVNCMKLIYKVLCPKPGVVEAVLCREGQQIEDGIELMKVKYN